MEANPSGVRFVLSERAMAAFDAESKRHLGRDQGSADVHYRGIPVVVDPKQLLGVRLEE